MYCYSNNYIIDPMSMENFRLLKQYIDILSISDIIALWYMWIICVYHFDVCNYLDNHFCSIVRLGIGSIVSYQHTMRQILRDKSP